MAATFLADGDEVPELLTAQECDCSMEPENRTPHVARLPRSGLHSLRGYSSDRTELGSWCGPASGGRALPEVHWEFQSWFATDAHYLDWLRWPEGFICPRCGHVDGWAVTPPGKRGYPPSMDRPRAARPWRTTDLGWSSQMNTPDTRLCCRSSSRNVKSAPTTTSGTVRRILHGSGNPPP